MITLASYVFNDKLLYLLFRVSVVDMDKFVQMVRAYLLLLLREDVNCFFRNDAQFFALSQDFFDKFCFIAFVFGFDEQIE